MVNKLVLRGGELIAYALVYQFSSITGVYTGGVPYLANWYGCSQNSARRYLHSLEAKGLIVHEDGDKNGVPYRNYKVVNSPILNSCEGIPQPYEGMLPPFMDDTTITGEGILPKLEADNNKNSKKKNKDIQRLNSPSIGDVTAFFEKESFNSDPRDFFDYYETNGWVQGKGNPIKNWKAAARRWNRFNESFITPKESAQSVHKRSNNIIILGEK